MDTRALLEQAEAADDVAAATTVAWLASDALADGTVAPVRRAMLLLAAGGDPHREIDTDDRAVRALADDLDGAAVCRALDALRAPAARLPRCERALEALEADPEHARRLVALALLAREFE